MAPSFLPDTFINSSLGMYFIMSKVDQDIKLTQEARNSISRFCYEECHALCCHKGFLPLNTVELLAVTDGKETAEVTKIGDDRYSLFMGKPDAPCPSLKDWKCSIYKNPNRPKVCGDYPIFLDRKKKEVKLSPRCTAVQEGKFYGYEAKMMALGYKIAKPHRYSEFEFMNVK